MMSEKTLVVIVGPTAVGKTNVAIQMAQVYHSEIISADSRQIYIEMEKGTAKPSIEELNLIPHHLINTHHISESYDAGQFVKDAKRITKSVFDKNDRVIMVGGSGLYISAFCDGLDEMPEVPSEIRSGLNDELRTNGLDVLLHELEKVDRDYFEQVDKMNPQRVIRGLEVFRACGLPFSSFRNQTPKAKHDFNIVKIGLELDREVLYQRINDRMDQMIGSGLFEEAESLYPYRNNNALKTVGYQEIFGYLDGEYDKEEAVRLLKRNSRRYAKRQMTWFKKDDDISWFDPNNIEEILQYLNTKVSD